jgi:Leucine-rich repeat (LRR) protein
VILLSAAGAVPAGAQTTANRSVSKAVAVFEKLGVTLTRDMKQPEQPVIAVISKSTNVGDGIAQIKAFKNLQTLSLRSCKITDAGLVLATKGMKFPELTSVELGENPLSDIGVISLLRAAPNLKTLDIFTTQISDATVKQARTLKQLERLHIAATRCTDLSIELLKGHPTLKELYAGGCVSDVGLTRLKELPLKRLSVGWTAKISDPGLALIPKAVPDLEWLDLNGARKITDAGVANLRGLTKLSGLSLYETEIGNPALDAIKEMKSLKSVNIKRTNVTDAGIEDLKKARPDLVVTH